MGSGDAAAGTTAAATGILISPAAAQPSLMDQDLTPATGYPTAEAAAAHQAPAAAPADPVPPQPPLKSSPQQAPQPAASGEWRW